MTQKAKPWNYNHLRKEWEVVKKEDETETSISKPLTHKQAIEMVIYLNRNVARTDIDLRRIPQ
jgi:hypothetical protein